MGLILILGVHRLSILYFVKLILYGLIVLIVLYFVGNLYIYLMESILNVNLLWYCLLYVALLILLSGLV